MEFWHFRECVMHSALVCTTCTAMRLSEPKWFGSVPVVDKLLQRFHNAP